MKQYTLFYTWQSDYPKAKSSLTKALQAVTSDLSKDGIELIVDQDTKGRVGVRNINTEILDKIENADIFVADLTPATTISPETECEIPRHMPNSNVMFEYGYAYKCLGEDRIILLAHLNKYQHIEFLPFDVNHFTITEFPLVSGSKPDREFEAFTRALTSWIRNIINNIENKRDEQQEYDCDLTLPGLSHEGIISPKYQVIKYNKKHEEVDENSKYLLIKDSLVNYGAGVDPLFSCLCKTKENLSRPLINLSLRNTGKKTLQFCEIRLVIESKGVSFYSSNVEYIDSAHPNFNFYPFISRITNEKTIDETVNLLKPEKSVGISAYVGMPYDVHSFIIKWTVEALDYHKEGTISMKVEPTFEHKMVDHPFRSDEEIADYIVAKY